MRTKYAIVAILFFLLNTTEGFGQCISSGAKSATVSGNDAGAGTIAWTSLANTVSSNDLRATAASAVAILSSSSTNYLTQSGFGFSIPSYAIICGIQVDAERRQQGVIVGSSVKDNSVKIIKGGSILGTEHASGSSWPSTDATGVYGGPTDLWGTTWTAADINASNFGVAYSASLNAGLAALFLSAEIDNVTVTVFYDLILPIKLIDFSASCNNDGVLVKWSTASESDNQHFIIERTKDGITFEEVAKIDGAKNKNERSDYSFVDHHPFKGTVYYRLKQIDGTGVTKDYSLVSVDCKFENIDTPFPNPSAGKFSINAEGELIIYGARGKSVYSQIISGNTQIDLSNQEKGVYFYQLRSSDRVISSGKLLVE